MCKEGLRVEVFDGSGKEFLSFGTMIGFVDVYIVRHENGLYSAHDAETKPEGFPEEVIQKIESNPKIQLDDGRIVYGCQVYWKKYEEKSK